jgi:hypothetical protein
MAAHALTRRHLSRDFRSSSARGCLHQIGLIRSNVNVQMSRGALLLRDTLQPETVVTLPSPARRVLAPNAERWDRYSAAEIAAGRGPGSSPPALCCFFPPPHLRSGGAVWPRTARRVTYLRQPQYTGVCGRF